MLQSKNTEWVKNVKMQNNPQQANIIPTDQKLHKNKQIMYKKF